MVAFCVRLYRLLLAAYPADFRRDYAPQMDQAFRASCSDATRRHGAPGLLAVGLVTLGDPS